MRQIKLNQPAIGFLMALGLMASAHAEVKISGAVDYSIERFTTKTNPGMFDASDNVVRMSNTLANYNYFSLSGKESLDSQLNATYEFSIKYDKGTFMPYLAHVGLEGGFGRLKLGNQWRPLFTAVAAIDPTQLAATPGFAGAGKSGTGLSGLAPEPNNNSITYNLPSPTPGMFIQVQKGQASTTQGDNYGAHIILTDGKKFFVAYALHNEKMLAGSIFAASATGTNGIDSTPVFGGLTLAQLTVVGQNGLNHRLYTSAAGGETRESSGVAGSYDFGSFKLVGGKVSESVKGTDAALNMLAIGLKIPVVDKINLGYLFSQAEHTRSTGTEFSITGNKVLLTYDFSKKTSLYYAQGKQKLDGGTTAGNEFSSAISALGLRHTF
jgi:predicted porin